MFFTIFYAMPVIINTFALYKEEKEYMDDYGETDLTKGQMVLAFVCFLIPVLNLALLFGCSLPELLSPHYDKISKWLDTPFNSKK